MISVRREVLRETNNPQVPWDHSSLTGQFYFVPPVAPAAPSASPAAKDFELDFWDSIKNEKNPRLFEAYLNRYPNGAFADIARIKLESSKMAWLDSGSYREGDNIALSDPSLLREIRERLYELNFDPGPLNGPIDQQARQAIREFQQASNLPTTGEASQGVLRRLREAGALKPWGAIVYARKERKWGMSWSQDTRQAAVASPRAACGSAELCPVEISFFGSACAAFAHSNSGYAIVARSSIKEAREAALSDCGKHSCSCRIVAGVCAGGAERYASR